MYVTRFYKQPLHKYRKRNPQEQTFLICILKSCKNRLWAFNIENKLCLALTAIELKSAFTW